MSTLTVTLTTSFRGVVSDTTGREVGQVRRLTSGTWYAETWVRGGKQNAQALPSLPGDTINDAVGRIDWAVTPA